MPYLITGAVVSIFPFLFSISISLMNLTEATSQTWLPSTPQWGNYVEAWEEADFSQFFYNSVRISLITLAGEVVFSIMAAYAFARMEFPGKNLIFGLMLATLTLPQAITWVPNFPHRFLVGEGNGRAMDRQLARPHRPLHGLRFRHFSAATILSANPR
jgi:ABC-type glycerol-3-phosphate transport system permease component